MSKSLIRDVAQDIIELKLQPSMTLQDLEKAFYSIMRRYGIKQGTHKGKGILCDNFEWTMCRVLFLDRLHSYFDFDLGVMGKVPDDLKC